MKRILTRTSPHAVKPAPAFPSDPDPGLTGRFTAHSGFLPGDIESLRALLGNIAGIVYRCRDDRYWTMEFVSAGCTESTTMHDAPRLLQEIRCDEVQGYYFDPPMPAEAFRQRFAGGDSGLNLRAHGAQGN